MSAITAQDLIDRGLVHEGAAEKAQILGRLESRQNDILAGGEKAASELEVTRFMSIADGPLERAIIGAFVAATGVNATDPLRLVSGITFQGESQVNGRRSIDLVVREPLSGPDDVPTPRIAIEAKFDAMVNGYENYCPRHSAEVGYSNQIICYVSGCTNPLLDANLSSDSGEQVKFVWLGLPLPAAFPAVAPLWGRKAINERDLRRPGNPFGEAHALQELATDHWTMMTWPTLYKAVAVAFDQADRDIVTAILRALRATPTEIERLHASASTTVLT